MFNRLSILTFAGMFFLTITYTVTTAQDTKEKYTHITGKIKEIDAKNQMITVNNKTRKGEVIDYDIRVVTTQTKYVFVQSINDLELGDVVSIKYRGPKGEYEAVKVKRIKKAEKD